MDTGRYLIKGGTPLKGVLTPSGAKNAALPILAATLLTKDACTLHNVPDIADVTLTLEILKGLGAKVTKQGDTVHIQADSFTESRIAKEVMQKMRASILFMGALLSRTGEAAIAQPGGCAIGKRPIDLHLLAMEAFGATLKEEDEVIYCKASQLTGAKITLPIPSVGATENILLTAVLAKGETILNGAAMEPEIVDLAEFLIKMGAHIYGAGTSVIRIQGVKQLHSVVHTLIPDRIEGATYLTAAAITGGELFLRDAQASHMQATCTALSQTGCIISPMADGIWIRAPKALNPIPYLMTGPHPEFPTDMQPQLMALLTLAEGTSMIVESIFDARFHHVPHLCAMGADIETEGRHATIHGVKRLHGAKVAAEDLRGGAALTLAALAAEGDTVLSGISYIERGYENFVEKLLSLGANIRCER